jgi:acyl-[acyl-carrier-protein]-phospholipid O-acyltransferase/long-chain-fatty-acid--[acyl-carrier-protein] ligase
MVDRWLRSVVASVVRVVYRIQVDGHARVPGRGPALLVANHPSLVDGVILGACLRRRVRFLVWAPYYRHPLLRPWLRWLRAIPVGGGGRREIATALAGARRELEAGHVVCIFAEGSVSRTGNLLPFKRGFERIVDGLDVPIVPVCLDRLWGSVFSFKRGRFFWKLPERLPYPVTVAFGPPLPSTSRAADVRLAMQELTAAAWRRRADNRTMLHTRFFETAKRRWAQPAMADSTGQSLTFGRALVGALLFARLIRRRTEGQPRVGLLLPASVGGALANIATLAAGRVPVNLNFTVGAEAMDAAISQAGIRTVLTSRAFITKASIEPRPDMVYLEDLRKEIGGVAKILALLEARLLPASWLARRHGGGAGTSPDDVATIIFSSGSTGIPKGVVISHRNILANVESLAQVYPVGGDDCFIGVLPLFHSFGFTGTFWFPLLQGARVAYHPNPMDAKTIGELAEQHRATMLISTPTFCQSYLRRITKEQFATLKYAIVGAEKLREPIATAFEQKYGVSLMEGYGCTEMSPVVAVNHPDASAGRGRQIGNKFGSVGHPIPGVAAKIVDRETGEEPLINREGRLLVKGQNLMQGYLDQPERTAEVIRDGWYVTGDIGYIDEDGFIFITDRESRFSKIGGEMVPHVKVEEAVNVALGEVASAVTAVPCETRGERLVAFYAKPDVTPDELWQRLNDTDLPKLWLPRRDSLVPIPEIPTLGTGKIDLRRLKDLAVTRTAAEASKSR